MVARGAEEVGREAGFEAAEGIMPPKISAQIPMTRAAHFVAGL